jgi:hypothetical protein
MDIKYLFAYNAKTNIDGIYSYNHAYRYQDFKFKIECEKGFQYRKLSDSTLLNSLLYQLDTILNYDYGLPALNLENQYEVNSFVLWKYGPNIFKPIRITERAGGGSYPHISLNERTGFINRLPDWSTSSLSSYLANGDGTYRLIPQGGETPVNTQWILNNLNFWICDYMDDPNVDAHKNEPYHIQVYSEVFLLDPTDAPLAFNFNFPKKLIFVNTTNFVSLIAKNIFKCFPPNSLIKLCDGFNDGVNNFIERDILIEQFPSRILMLDQSLEVTQIDNNKFIVEHTVSSKLQFSDSYIDFTTSKVYHQLHFNNKLQPISASILWKNNTVTQIKNILCDIIDMKDADSIYAINYSIERLLHNKYYLRLNLEKFVYYFFKTSPNTMGCIRFDGLFINLTLISDAIPIDPSMINLSDTDSIILLKNYGQFPPNHYLVLKKDNVAKNEKGNFTRVMAACWLIQNDSGNFVFSAPLDLNNNPYMRFACDTQIKLNNKLYMFWVEWNLEKEIANWNGIDWNRTTERNQHIGTTDTINLHLAHGIFHCYINVIEYDILTHVTTQYHLYKKNSTKGVVYVLNSNPQKAKILSINISRKLFFSEFSISKKENNLEFFARGITPHGVNSVLTILIDSNLNIVDFDILSNANITNRPFFSGRYEIYFSTSYFSTRDTDYTEHQVNINNVHFYYRINPNDIRFPQVTDDLYFKPQAPLYVFKSGFTVLRIDGTKDYIYTTNNYLLYGYSYFEMWG